MSDNQNDDAAMIHQARVVLENASISDRLGAELAAAEVKATSLLEEIKEMDAQESNARDALWRNMQERDLDRILVDGRLFVRGPVQLKVFTAPAQPVGA